MLTYQLPPSLRVAIAAALAILANACSTIEVYRVEDTEELLASAGFSMKPADTPEKLEHVKAMPQHVLTPQQKDGKTLYIFADASVCRCVYTGTEEQYKRFQEMVRQKHMDMDQFSSGAMNDPTSGEWGVRGTGPWWLY